MEYDFFTCEDFSFRCEADEHYQLLFHMDVYNWNHSVLKRMRRIASDGLLGIKNQGFAVAYCVTPNPGLVQLVCPGEVQQVLMLDGINHEVIVWELY